MLEYLPSIIGPIERQNFVSFVVLGSFNETEREHQSFVRNDGLREGKAREEEGQGEGEEKVITRKT